MSQAALLQRGAPQRRSSTHSKSKHAFMVRATSQEWDALKWAADQYGEAMGDFAEDAILTWLDRNVDIPRRIFMPPMNARTTDDNVRRLHLDRNLTDQIEGFALGDEMNGPLQISKSDIVMSAVLSFVQGMLDKRHRHECVRIPHGAAVIDRSRPSLIVKLLH